MSVVIFILKIIGIILSAVLGILLFLLLMALFVPIAYRVEGEANQTYKFRGKLHWLFRIITVHIVYEEADIAYDVRVFGIRFRKRKKDVSGEETFGSQSSMDFEEEQLSECHRQEEKEVSLVQPERDEGEVLFAQKEQHNEDVSRIQPGCDRTHSVFSSRGTKKKDRSLIHPVQRGRDELSILPEQGARGKASSVVGNRAIAKEDFQRKKQKKRGTIKEQIQSFFQKAKKSVRKLWYTLTHIKDKATDFKKEWKDETNRLAVVFVFRELKYLLNHFRFRKMLVNLEFSMGDPALTGQALGIFSMMPFLYRYAVYVNPDFDAEQIYLRGDFCISGHVRIVHLAAVSVRIWRHKESRAVIKRFLK